MLRGSARVFAFALAMSAATLSVGSARADEKGGAASTTDPAAKEKSRAAFRRGVGQLRSKEWTAARASFEEAYQLFPHPSILLNLGITQLRTNDPVLAEQNLTKFLSEDAGSSQDEIAGAREALAEAKSKVGTVRVVASPPSARVTIDGRRIENVKRAEGDTVVAEVRAKPGRHAVVVEAEGFGTEKRDVELQAKGEGEVKVALVESTQKKDVVVVPKRADGTSTRTVVGWTLVGVAGAAAIGGGAFALVAKNKADEYNEQRGGLQDPDLKSSGTTFRTLADVSFGVAIVSGVIGVVLLVTDIGASKNAALSPSRSPADFRIEPKTTGALFRW